jgi:barstar (barnase inhibitor)
MTAAVDRPLAGEVTPGVYRMDMTLRPGTICRKAENAGWQCAYLNGSKLFDKNSLLRHCATVLDFPDYFGHNWDALDECMTEPGLIHGDGLILLYDHAAMLYANSPRDWATFYDIIISAIDYWHNQDKSVYFILRNSGAIPQKVASL